MDTFHLNRKWLCKRNLPTGRTETGLCEVWMRLNVLRHGRRARNYRRVLGLRLRVPPRCSTRPPATDRRACQPPPSHVATRPLSTGSAMIRSSPGPPRRSRCKSEDRPAGTGPPHRGGLHRPGRRAHAPPSGDWPIGESIPLQVAGSDRCWTPWRRWSVLPPFTVRRRTSAGSVAPYESKLSQATMQETDRHSVVQAT